MFNTLERDLIQELQKLILIHLLESPRKGILNIAIDDIGAQEIFDVLYNSPERGNKLNKLNK